VAEVEDARGTVKDDDECWLDSTAAGNELNLLVVENGMETAAAAGRRVRGEEMRGEVLPVVPRWMPPFCRWSNAAIAIGVIKILDKRNNSKLKINMSMISSEIVKKRETF
jgi:hypothetical protein